MLIFFLIGFGIRFFATRFRIHITINETSRISLSLMTYSHHEIVHSNPGTSERFHPRLNMLF